MRSPKQPATDDEIREVLRRGRFEDLSVLTAIGAMVSIIVLVLVIQLGGPADLLFPAVEILCAVGILATGAWVVGNIRTTRALDRLEGPSRPQRRPARVYVLAIGLAVTVGATYWFAPEPIRRWLWSGWVVASTAAYVWIQTRPGNRRSRHRR
jgi:hypothetical protein